MDKEDCVFTDYYIIRCFGTLTLRLADGLDNEAYLQRGKATGVVREALMPEVGHQLGLQGYPLHEFAPGSRAAQVRAIEECQFCLSVHAVMKCFHIRRLVIDRYLL